MPILIYWYISLYYLYTTLSTEENKEKIRNFIIKKDGKVTKNNVVDYMEKEGEDGSSRVTTLKMIDDLESAGIIEVLRGKRQGQSHYLRINTKNEYNRISEELSKIEKIVDVMQDPVDRILKLRGEEDDTNYNLPEFRILRNLDFVQEYYNSMDNMLDVLLCHTTIKVHSEKEAWSLYTRIIKLKAKVNEHIRMFFKDGFGWLLLNYKSNLDNTLHELKGFHLTQADFDFAKECGIKINLVGDLIEKIETFKKEFLEKIESLELEFLGK